MESVPGSPLLNDIAPPRRRFQVFESWSHFPLAKARLLRLFSRLRPRGLVLLSGDVHFGEVLAWPPASDAAPGVASGVAAASAGEEGGVDLGVVGCGRLLEVTSSGLTHSIASSAKTQVTSGPVLAGWTSHRLAPGALTTGANFGTLAVDWGGDGEPVLRAAVVSADTGETRMSVARTACRLDIARKEIEL